jgi:hypothetical protein
MKNKQELLNHVIDFAVVDAANDIKEYLASDVPIECYAKDIDIKLSFLQKRLRNIIYKLNLNN